MRSLIFGDRHESWPELRVMLLPLPWTWRMPYFWRDEGMTSSFLVEVGPFVVEYYGD